MASRNSQQGKGNREERRRSRPQNLVSSNPGRSGHGHQGSASSGSGDQRSMVHGWYPLQPGPVANAWGYPPSTVAPQSQWRIRMTRGCYATDPPDVIQESMSSGDQGPIDPPPGGPSAGGGKRTVPNPKKPADDAWLDVIATMPGVPYPDWHGMKSRPYEPDEDRPYPMLEQHRVVYRSEIGQGSYPLSCVPVFSD
eukprot:6456601-Amphidinium_carterae.1